MYRDVVLEDIVTLLGVHVRPCVKLDSKAIEYAVIAKVFAIFVHEDDVECENDRKQTYNNQRDITKGGSIYVTHLHRAQRNPWGLHG